MDETLNTQNRVTEGFSFYTEKDAELAELERKKIDYLQARMDYSQPEQVLRIYEKVIRERVFKTPVGLFYLKQVQNYLLGQEKILKEQVIAIPLYQSFHGEVREEQSPARSRVKPSEKKEKQKKERRASALSISVILNLLLSAAIIAMFAIALNADQPNILNYETVITNRYATWEQELIEREQIVREKERELKIETE